MLGHQISLPFTANSAKQRLTHHSEHLGTMGNPVRRLARSPFWYGQWLDQRCDFLQCHHQCMWERTSLVWCHALWRKNSCFFLLGDWLFTGERTTIVAANFCWFLDYCKVKHIAMDAATRRPLHIKQHLKTTDPVQLDGLGTWNNRHQNVWVNRYTTLGC